MTMKKLTILMGLISALSTTNVLAQTENHAGSNCVRRSGGETAYDFSGAIYNTSRTQKAYILCNIPHTDFDGFLNAGEVDMVLDYERYDSLLFRLEVFL